MPIIVINVTKRYVSTCEFDVSRIENDVKFLSVISQVVTIKRLCVRKLPPVLAIQLKRFEYDYERDCAIKFNDYFEFPRELDMEPYTGKLR